MCAREGHLRDILKALRPRVPVLGVQLRTGGLGLGEDAEPLLKKALQTFVETLGEEHSLTASALYRLGEHYSNQARYDEAEQYFERALNSAHAVYGEEPESMVLPLNMLASLYTKQGKKAKEAEARPAVQRTLAWSKHVGLGNAGLDGAGHGRWKSRKGGS